MLSDRCLCVLSVLSVTLVYCGQTVGWIKMKLSIQVGLGPGHIILDGDPAHHLPKGHSPPFSAHICCGQMAGWIKMPLGRKVGLDPSDITLDGDPAPCPKPGRAPQFSAHVYCGQRAGYDTIWYDMTRLTILTCAQKLTSSQLNLPHGTERKK